MEENFSQPQSFGNFDFSPIPEERRRKKKVVAVVLIAFLLVVTGIIGVLAARIWDPLWNPFRPSPELVLARAIENMFSLKSYHSEANINIDATNLDTQEAFKMNLQIDSDINEFDEKEPKSHSIFTTNVGVQGVNFILGGETIQIGEETYIKINTLPVPLLMELQAEFPNLNQIVDKLKNQWISFNPKDLGMSMGINSLTPQERKEIEQKFQNLVFKYPLVKIKKELPDQTIDGQKMYQILTVLDKENTKLYLAEALKLVEEYNLFPDASYDEKEIAQLNKAIDEFFDKAGEIEIYFLVGQNDYFIHQIKGMKTIEKFTSETEQGTENVSMELVWNVSVSDFNKQKKIERPKESQSIMEIFMNLLTNYYGSSSGNEMFYPQLETEYPSMEIPGL
ncbi:hypothetical protein J7K92_01340 [bacterium]|nr:hypothetical protein [bacterium]